MAKLYFRYGTVGSAKTLNLLAVAHNYRQQGKKVALVKPNIDVRFGRKWIRSRAGLEEQADILVDDTTRLTPEMFSDTDCIVVDEAQFLPVRAVDELREVTIAADVPAICYGLRTDFRGDLFPGSRRLCELADTIEEVKTTCAFCDRKAIMNLKHVNGVATVEGPSIDLGAEERYLPSCFRCYRAQLEKRAGGLPAAANS